VQYCRAVEGCARLSCSSPTPALFVLVSSWRAADVYVEGLSSKTYFIMRAAQDARVLSCGPPMDGFSFLLKWCDSADRDQLLLVKSFGGGVGQIVSAPARIPTSANTYDTTHVWGFASFARTLAESRAVSGDVWSFPRDSTRLKSYRAGRLLPGRASGGPSPCLTSHATPVPEQAWIVETPGKASAPAPASDTLRLPCACPRCAPGVPGVLPWAVALGVPGVCPGCALGCCACPGCSACPGCCACPRCSACPGTRSSQIRDQWATGRHGSDAGSFRVDRSAEHRLPCLQGAVLVSRCLLFCAAFRHLSSTPFPSPRPLPLPPPSPPPPSPPSPLPLLPPSPPPPSLRSPPPSLLPPSPPPPSRSPFPSPSPSALPLPPHIHLQVSPTLLCSEPLSSARTAFADTLASEQVGQ